MKSACVGVLSIIAPKTCFLNS